MAKLIPVAKLAKLEKDQPLCVEHRGVPYCVIRVGEAEVHAFVSICSHKNLAMFPPEVKKHNLLCPYHHAAFDPATGKLAKSSRTKADRLLSAKTEIIDGVVHLKARKKHRKLVSKSVREWVKKKSEKLGQENRV